METFGDKLSNLRKNRRLSQEKLGAELGVSRQTIYNWEANVITPKSDNIKAICDYFGISSEELYADCEPAAQDETSRPVAAAAGPITLGRVLMPAFVFVFALTFIVALIRAVRIGCAMFSENGGASAVYSDYVGADRFVLCILLCVLALYLFVTFLILTKKAFVKAK